MNRLLSLLEDLDKGLLQIESSDNLRLEKCRQKIKHCERMMSLLRQTFLEIPAVTVEDEIYFFKSIKPKFTGELHFQTALFDYFKTFPKGSLKEKKSFINSSLDRASSYLQRYNEFHTYIKTGSDHLDHLYFKNIEFDLKIHLSLEHPMDREFTAPAGPTLTCIICAERFIQFLLNELYTLEHPNLEPSWESHKKLSWSGSKTDLVELIYALHASKLVENEIKDIVALFEPIFGLQLGNFYRVYTDIKYKKNPSSFLDQLKFSLLEKIRSENQ